MDWCLSVFGFFQGSIFSCSGEGFLYLLFLLSLFFFFVRSVPHSLVNITLLLGSR
jgi:hypothetical protein